MKKSPFCRAALSCIAFYREKLSDKKKAPTCKYYPSCSEYAFRTYETHGFFRATLLSLWRLLRCNPFSHGGIDYVPGTPERKERQRDLWKKKKEPKKVSFPAANKKHI